MTDEVQQSRDEEISLKKIVAGLISTFSFLWNKALGILLVALVGAGLGYIIAAISPVKYRSRLTFVLEESKSTGGGLASIAGQFGIDMGGDGGGGIFNGDNIFLFLKSQSLVRETLLQPFNQEPKTLADQYALVNNLSPRWEQNKKIGKILFYKNAGQALSRTEDSLLQVITETIIRSDLKVGRPDKKASFIEVSTAMPDEALSKAFCDKLVGIALETYVSSKIKVKDANVRRLQRRADSLEAILNARTYNAAASQQSLLDINPGLRSVTAAPEIRTREKMTVAAIYTEVVKNLEMARTILNQETPTITLVDQSSFPLKKEKTSKLTSMISLAVLFAFLYSISLLVRHWWRTAK